jgi:hypothetical protein
MMLLEYVGTAPHDRSMLSRARLMPRASSRLQLNKEILDQLRSSHILALQHAFAKPRWQQ